MSAPKKVRIARIAAVVAVIATLVTVTRDRNVDYQSEEGLWADTVRKRPSNARARNNYATVLLASGRVHQGEEHLRVAVQINPRYPEAETALGSALAAQERFDEAMSHLRRAIALKPDYAAAHQNLAEAYASRRDLASAVRHYQRALELKPDDVFLMNRIGWILATAADAALRDGTRAADLGERAVHLTARSDVDSLDTLAAAYAELGRFSDAIAVEREALALARAQRVTIIVPELEHRLRLYESKQPFRGE